MSKFKKSLLLLAIMFYSANSFAGMLDAEAGGDDGGSSLGDSYDSYTAFDYGNSINWSDCFDIGFSIGADACPSYPYFTLTLVYMYNDIVAMVEVVPDPWRSYLYDEAFYDFEGEADTALPSSAGVNVGIGDGYSNTGGSNAKESIGVNRMETHVWAISDWWRLQTSSQLESCISLTCKVESLSGCGKIKNSSNNMSDGMQNTISSMNSNQEAEGKGQGVKNGETGEVSYEDGSVYEEKTDQYGNGTGEYEQTRAPGNYGDGDTATSADIGESGGAVGNPDSSQSFMDSIQNNMNFDSSSLGGSFASISQQMASNNDGDEVSEDEDSESDPSLDASISNVNSEVAALDISGENAEPLPAETTTGGSTFGNSSSGTESGSEQNGGSGSGSDQDDPFNNSSAGNSAASSNMMSKSPSLGGNLGDSLSSALAMVDRVVYFNVMEQIIQMIAAKVPVMVHPVFMTERHKKASATGGFFWAPIFKKFADMGAGMIMPMFCLTKTLAMVPDAAADLAGFEGFNLLDMLGDTVGSFINGRCVGSWGPLEPRVNLIASGDPFVSAGIASVRGLNVAQNITGGMYNKSINNTPFTELKFNLDWPHTSECYGFDGAEGVSRGWTSPMVGQVDSLADSILSGDSASANMDTSGVSVPAKQGGYVFTYWRKRKCRYLFNCKQWRGDTGL